MLASLRVPIRNLVLSGRDISQIGRRAARLVVFLRGGGSTQGQQDSPPFRSHEWSVARDPGI